MLIFSKEIRNLIYLASDLGVNCDIVNFCIRKVLVVLRKEKEAAILRLFASPSSVELVVTPPPYFVCFLITASSLFNLVLSNRSRKNRIHSISLNILDPFRIPYFN